MDVNESNTLTRIATTLDEIKALLNTLVNAKYEINDVCAPMYGLTKFVITRKKD